jgi:hypothetical protein
MRVAGYKENTCRVKQGAKLAQVMPTIQALMEKRGLTDDRLLDVLHEGLNAKKISYYQKDGIVTDEREDRDLVTAHKYLDTGLKLRGHLKERLSLENPDGTPLELTITFVTAREAIDISPK